MWAGIIFYIFILIIRERESHATTFFPRFILWHIAIRTNSVELAVAELAKKGFAYDESSAKCKNGRMTVAYLKDEFGGFAVHLLQK